MATCKSRYSVLHVGSGYRTRSPSMGANALSAAHVAGPSLFCPPTSKSKGWRGLKE